MDGYMSSQVLRGCVCVFFFNKASQKQAYMFVNETMEPLKL